MKIVVEGAPLQLELPPNRTTLKQAMDAVEAYLADEGRIPVALTINGSELSPEQIEQQQHNVLLGDEILSFHAITFEEFLTDSLDGAEEANHELIALMTRFCESAYSNTHDIDNQSLVDEFTYFLEYWDRLNTLMPEELELLECDQTLFSQLFEELRALHEETAAALESGEAILAADLLQYEMIPAVESLHRAIPKLRELVQCEKAKAVEAT